MIPSQSYYDMPPSGGRQAEGWIIQGVVYGPGPKQSSDLKKYYDSLFDTSKSEISRQYVAALYWKRVGRWLMEYFYCATTAQLYRHYSHLSRVILPYLLKKKEEEEEGRAHLYSPSVAILVQQEGGTWWKRSFNCQALFSNKWSYPTRQKHWTNDGDGARRTSITSRSKAVDSISMFRALQRGWDHQSLLKSVLIGHEPVFVLPVCSD